MKISVSLLFLLNPKTAVETTKDTKYTKHERVMRGILLTHLESILAAPNLCPFVYFVSFVVPIALSRSK